jgi:hypothetical protein
MRSRPHHLVRRQPAALVMRVRWAPAPPSSCNQSVCGRRRRFDASLSPVRMEMEVAVVPHSSCRVRMDQMMPCNRSGTRGRVRAITTLKVGGGVIQCIQSKTAAHRSWSQGCPTRCDSTTTLLLVVVVSLLLLLLFTRHHYLSASAVCQGRAACASLGPPPSAAGGSQWSVERVSWGGQRL